MPNKLYEILGVEKNATGEEINEAYDAAIEKCQNNPEEEQAALMEIGIAEYAHKILSDDTQRIKYDAGEIDDQIDSIQKIICRESPKIYLKIASEAIQEELCHENPVSYFEHATLETQKKLCFAHPSIFIKLANSHLQSQYRFDLSQQDSKTQTEVCSLDPRSLFYASTDIQTSVCEKKPEHLYLAAPHIQKNLCNKDPKKYLPFADPKIQSDLLRKAPHPYVNYANSSVQKDLSKTNPETYLRLASDEIQIEYCKKNPAEYLKHAKESIQIKLCETDPSHYLQSASDSVKENFLPKLNKVKQTTLCQENPASLLRFASDSVQNEMCKNKNMLLFSAKSYKNISDAMSASIAKCSRSWLSKGKQEKIEALKTCQEKYLENPSIDNLRAFIKKASEARESRFREAKPGETKTLETFITALSEPIKSALSYQDNIMIYLRHRFFSEIRDNRQTLNINNKSPGAR